MLVHRVSAVAACVVLLGVSVVGAQDKPHPRSKLETAIPEAIRLLEAKEFATMLKEFVAPEDLKKITDRTPLEDFAARFAGEKADKLLEVLKAVRNEKPELNSDGTVASFALPEALRTTSRVKIEFLKVDELWYIKN